MPGAGVCMIDKAVNAGAMMAAMAQTRRARLILPTADDADSGADVAFIAQSNREPAP